MFNRCPTSCVRLQVSLVLVAFVGMVAGAAEAQNVLRNASFEDVPAGGASGQERLPLEWIAVRGTPDTYSSDGTYGIDARADNYGNFDDVAARDGVRWVGAGAAGFDETVGQLLSEPLIPGQRYQLRAWIRQSGPSRPEPGGFCLRLFTGGADPVTAYSNDWRPACCLAVTDQAGEWQPRECSFVAPQGSVDDAVAFVPTWAESSNAYPGIDDVSLGISCGNGLLDVPWEECDDGNDVNGDCCSAECQFENVDSSCFINPGRCAQGACDGQGSCLDGEPISCGVDPDPNDCRVPACDPESGACVLALLPGFSRCAGDADSCTLEFCTAAGQCLVGEHLECDDGNSCNGAETCIEVPDSNGSSIPNLACQAGIAPAEGSPCNSDGVVCTNDTCLGGACAHSVDDAACDDGFSCTVDHCIPTLGGCINAADDTVCRRDTIFCTAESCAPDDPAADVRGCLVQPDDVACDDDSACTVDRCDLTLGCQYENPCDDGDLCTVDHCGFDPVADEVVCQNKSEPQPVCDVAGGSLDLRDPPGGQFDRIKWSWGNNGADPGAVTDLGAADPGENVGNRLDYALCVWDHRPNEVHASLWAQLDVPPGLRNPPMQPAGWRILNRGERLMYVDARRANDGVASVAATASPVANRARASLVGRGANLPFAELPASASQLLAQSPRVQVQLVNELGACWETSFERTDVLRHDATRFHARD